MRIFIFLFFLTISCSFDDKSGIWKNENVISKKEKKYLKDLKHLNQKKKFLKKISD